MKNFRAVVVGTGFIGPVHVEGLRRAGVQVAGILGSSSEKSRVAAARLGLERGYASLEEVLEDAAVDAVHLTSPNRYHYEQASAVLRARKHVLCEKPLAMDSRQSAALLNLAKNSGVAAGVAYNIRFYPLCHEAAARVRSGGLGTILHVHGSYVQDWLLYDTDFNWRVLAEDGGNLRAIADIGTHWLDLVQFITARRVVSVCADLRTIHLNRKCPTSRAVPSQAVSNHTFSSPDSPGRSQLLSQDRTDWGSQATAVPITTEDCGAVLLKFDNGINGVLWVSQTTAGRKNCLRFEVGGSEQGIAWNSEEPNLLWVGNRSRANEQLIRDPALLGNEAAQISNYPGGHNEGFPDTFKQLFRAFYGYIDEGDFNKPPPFPTFAEGHLEIQLCEAILASHRTRSWVDVGVS
jgi:predicted dehydrogenase